MTSSSADLLKELRIDRSARQAPPPPRGLWIGIAVAALVILLLAIGGWWLLGRADPVEVRTATVEAMSAGGGASQASSVLDATGYVVARRMATVSAKITGKVREVLIEEGQHVEAGEVLATLDPVDADAQRDLAAAQLGAARSQAVGVQAQLREAESNAERLGSLVQQQLVSKSLSDQAIAARDALRALDHDGFSWNRHHALSLRWSMIFLRKPVPTIRDHALSHFEPFENVRADEIAQPRLLAETQGAVLDHRVFAKQHLEKRVGQ